jgi:hypothetical protein
MANRRPPIYDDPLYNPDESGDQSQPWGNNEIPDTFDSYNDDVSPGPWNWDTVPYEGYKSWWEAGQPTHLREDKEGWWGKGIDDWWPDPGDYARDFEQIRQSGRSHRGLHWDPSAAPMADHGSWGQTYEWAPGGGQADIGDREAMQGSLQQYLDMFGDGTNVTDPWSQQTAFGRASNIGHLQRSYNEVVNRYNQEADKAKAFYDAEQIRIQQQQELQRQMQACAARGGTWVNGACKEYEPPTDPYEAEKAACAAKGGTWRGPGDCHVEPTGPTPSEILRQNIAKCEASGGTWDGTRCIAPDDDPRRSGLIDGDVSTTNYADQSTAGGPLLDDMGLPPGGGETEVGTDPLSEAITSQLLSLLEGDESSVQKQLRNRIASILSGDYTWEDIQQDPNLIEQDLETMLRSIVDSQGGELYGDPSQLAMQLEQVRTPLDALRRAQQEQSMAALAHRGLAGTSGAEGRVFGNIEERLAPQYVAGGQEIALEAMDAREERLADAMSGLQELGQTQAQRQVGYDALNAASRQALEQLGMQQASQMSNMDIQNTLAAVGMGTQRQQVLSDIALRSLDQNSTWNQFLAEFGMNRDATLEALRLGRTDQLMPILELFRDFVDYSRSGMVSEGAPPQRTTWSI